VFLVVDLGEPDFHLLGFRPGEIGEEFFIDGQVGKADPVRRFLASQLSDQPGKRALRFGELDPEGVIVGAQRRRLQERIVGAEAEEIVAAGNSDRLPHCQPRSERLLSGSGDVAGDIDRAVFGDDDRHLVGVDEIGRYTSGLSW